MSAPLQQSNGEYLLKPFHEPRTHSQADVCSEPFATLITAQNTVPPSAPQPSFLQKKGLLGAAGRGGVKPGCVRFRL